MYLYISFSKEEREILDEKGEKVRSIHDNG